MNNNNVLENKRIALQDRLETLIKQSNDTDAQIKKLLVEQEQTKRNFDAVSGALQLIDELIGAAPISPPDNIECLPQTNTN